MGRTRFGDPEDVVKCGYACGCGDVQAHDGTGTVSGSNFGVGAQREAATGQGGTDHGKHAHEREGDAFRSRWTSLYSQ